MTETLEFVPNTDGRVCDVCGSLLGRIGDREACPACNEGGLPRGADASFLYRARALLFVPDRDRAGPQGAAEGCDEVGRIIAVRPEEVTSEAARRRSPVVATDVCWPRDRKRFGELFDHHVHHVDGPLVQPPNDGWDADHDLPVL